MNIMKTSIKKFAYGVASLGLAVPTIAFGQGWGDNDGGIGLADGAPATQDVDIAQIIANVVNWVFTFLGILAVLMILIAGIMYLTAAGDESRAEKAKGILTYAVIGLIISILAVAITRIVVDTLVQ